MKIESVVGVKKAGIGVNIASKTSSFCDLRGR